MSSNFILIPSIAFCCYTFLLLAFIAAKKTPEVKAFIFALACCLLWTGGSTLMRLEAWPGIKIWYDISLAGLFLLAWAMYLFILIFTGRKPSLVSHLWLCLVIAMTVFNSITGLLLKAPSAVATADGISFEYSIGWPVIIFFIVCGGIIFNTFYNIALAWRKNEILKRQLKPLIAGIASIFLMQLLLLLPQMNGFPIDVFSALVMVICFIYALYERHLIRMTLLISKGACYAASAIFAAAIFSNCIRPLENFFQANLSDIIKDETLIISIMFTVFTVCMYYIMKLFIDKVFIKDEYIRASTIKDFSENVSSTLRIDEILDRVISVINDTIQADSVYVFIEDSSDSYYKIVRSLSPLDDRSVCLKNDNPLIEYLSRRSECILYADFQRLSAWKSMWEEEKNSLNQLGIQCFAPLNDDEGLIGIIAVSRQYSKSRITYDDIDFLSSVSSIASIAVKNSQLYEKAYMEARTDELTGLLNRKYFYETLKNECSNLHKDSLSLVIKIGRASCRERV